MKHLHTYKSNGRAYTYFKPKGRQAVRLTADPNTPEFFRQYADALAAHEADPEDEPAPARHVEADTVAALVRAYWTSRAYRKQRATTRKAFAPIIAKIEADHGSRRLSAVTPAWLRAQLHAKAATPAAAFNLLRRWRALFRAGIEAGLLEPEANPMRSIEANRPKNDGLAAWKADDVKKFADYHGPGSTAFLALVLAAETAQRRGDLVKMGPPDLLVDAASRVVGHGIKQTKTGAEVFAPLTEPLAWAIMATERPGRTTWLVTEAGRPFTVNGFGNRFRRWSKAAGVAKPLHGLRKYGLTTLLNNGASAVEAMALSGHTSFKEFSNYVKTRDRRALSIRAFGGTVAKLPAPAVANSIPERGPSHMAPALFAMVVASPAGFEPATTSLEGRCSIP